MIFSFKSIYLNTSLSLSSSLPNDASSLPNDLKKNPLKTRTPANAATITRSTGRFSKM
jgi:hypothetical protein